MIHRGPDLKIAFVVILGQRHFMKNINHGVHASDVRRVVRLSQPNVIRCLAQERKNTMIPLQLLPHLLPILRHFRLSWHIAF